ncbi:hypothetical protein [Ferrovibrio sp.]|uniref:hypothetical protein n=1 Tax=Ferrovibrio sp. TaxID=1917215 RepID=UPI003D0D6378
MARQCHIIGKKLPFFLRRQSVLPEKHRLRGQPRHCQDQATEGQGQRGIGGSRVPAAPDRAAVRGRKDRRLDAHLTCCIQQKTQWAGSFSWKFAAPSASLSIALEQSWLKVTAMLKRILVAAAMSLAVFTGMAAMPSHAQQDQQALTALPPALRAAVLSGNSSAITAAINTLSGGNPAQQANFANLVVTAAEVILATNPQAAVAAASAAVSAVNAIPVQTSSPQQALSTVTIASRIFLRPEVIATAPQIAASGSVMATQVASSPSVYAANPTAAISVMSNAYQVVTNQTVAAAAPAAATSVVNTLNQASQNNSLNSANPSNGSQIAAILNQPRETGGNVNNNNSGNTAEPVVRENPVYAPNASPT